MRCRLILVVLVIVETVYCEQSFCQGTPATRLYADWITGKKQLIDDNRATEFETFFRGPVFHAIPRLEDIVAIYGELEVTTELGEGPGIRPIFKIPAKYHRDIWVTIKDCKVDTRPRFEGSEAGSLKIYTANVQMTRISWYPVRINGQLSLSVHGIRYIGKEPEAGTDPGLAFTRLIERAEEDARLDGERRKR